MDPTCYSDYNMLCCDLSFLVQKYGKLNEKLVRTAESLISMSITFLSLTRFPWGGGGGGATGSKTVFSVKIHILYRDFLVRRTEGKMDFNSKFQ